MRTIVSAVQGQGDVIVDGQARLLDAALANGVERLIPSDFSIGLQAVPVGLNAFLDLRRRFAETLLSSGLGWTLFYNGGFTEVMLAPFFGMVDEAVATLSYWGDGQAAMDLTTMDDAAAYVAAVALDPSTAGQRIRVAGDEVSALDIAKAYADAGRPLEARRLGSIEDGYAELERRKAAGAPFIDVLALVYGLPMMSGAAKMSPLDNGRYPKSGRHACATSWRARLRTPDQVHRKQGRRMSTTAPAPHPRDYTTENSPIMLLDHQRDLMKWLKNRPREVTIGVVSPDVV